MLESLTNAFRIADLRRKILFTLGILGIYRLAAHVPAPGVNREVLEQAFASDTTGQLVGLLNMLSGGALETFSVVSMGVYPYITASIIMQLMVPLIPSLEELSKEGEQGRNKITQYTYWMTVPLALLQAVAQVQLLNTGVGADQSVVTFGISDPISSVTFLLALVAGSMFTLWLGERITEDGIGNGVSIIIFGGIVALVPQNLIPLWGNWLPLILVSILTVLTVAAIVVIQEGHRRIPVQYGKRVRGMKVYGGQSTHVPLRINSAGMIPLIFASSILIFPPVMGSALMAVENPTLQDLGLRIQAWFDPSGAIFFFFYFLMVVAFTFFYTDVIFRQQNLHETLQRQGGFVPGIRPGQRTENYLNGIMHRITLVGAVFLGIVAILPFFAQGITNLPPQQSLIITSMGLLIVVGVVLDTIKQLEAQLLMRHYEGFIK